MFIVYSFCWFFNLCRFHSCFSLVCIVPLIVPAAWNMNGMVEGLEPKLSLCIADRLFDYWSNTVFSCGRNVRYWLSSFWFLCWRMFTVLWAEKPLCTLGRRCEAPGMFTAVILKQYVRVDSSGCSSSHITVWKLLSSPFYLTFLQNTSRCDILACTVFH